MKKSDKIISTILILAILIGGGYFAAKHFGLIGGSAAVIEEPEGIETVEVWNNSEWDYYSSGYHGENAYNDFLKDTIITAIENSPATYFTGDYKSEGENADFQNVYQMDKATFESKVTKAKINQMTNGITEDIDACLNKDFSCSLSKEIEELEYEYQVWNIDLDYLIENEVELKCENITVEKLCAADDGSFPNSLVRIYAICSVDVTTIASNGDLSNTVFGDIGETVTLKAYLVGGGTNISGYDGYLNYVELIR